jgi:aldehyde dehydrogenase (NAD+)
MNQLPAFIAGKSVQTEQQVLVEDPSTGQVIASTPDCGPAEIDQAVTAARAASHAWRAAPVAERAAVLRRISVLLQRDMQEIGRLESQQTGKPLAQGLRDAEIAVRYFDFYASAIEMFYGSTIPLNNDTFIFTRWEPHGVTGHIIPWNYPLQILGRSVAPSLAMGNATVATGRTGSRGRPA